MNFKEIVQKALLEAIGKPGVEVQLEHPENEEFGDYSANVAMLLFAKSKAQNSCLRRQAKLQKPQRISAGNNWRTSKKQRIAKNS